MNTRVFFFITICLITSCSINPIVETYENRWQLKLTEEISLPANGFFSGLSNLPDGSILSVHQSIGENNDINLAFLRTTQEGESEEVEKISIPGFNVDLNQRSNGERISILGQSKSSGTEGLIISFEPPSTASQSRVDLSEALRDISLVRRHLSKENLYLSGQDIPRQKGYSVVKASHSGILIWSTYIGEMRPLLLKEGFGANLVILEQKTGDKQSLLRLNHEGGNDWQTDLTGENGVVANLETAVAFEISPSNTITVVGSSSGENLMIAFIDPRGDFMFSRLMAQYDIGQYRDFLITKDGGFFLALAGDRLENDISFTVLRLNHRAAVTWQGDYIFNSLPDEVSLIELTEGLIAILSNDGRLVAINPT